MTPNSKDLSHFVIVIIDSKQIRFLEEY